MSQSRTLSAVPLPGQAAASRPWALSLPLLTAAYAYLLTLYQGHVLKLVLMDGDSFWHLATGQAILRQHRVPSADPFSHSLPGAPWTAQEWLSQVLFALAHDQFGWSGMVMLTGLAFAAAVALLTRELQRSLPPARTLLLVVVGVLLAVVHLLARPHMLAMPILVGWTIAMARAVEAGRAPSVWLLPLMTLWANLHGGFTLGLVLACAFALDAVVGAPDHASRRRLALRWGLFVAAAALAATLTPNGARGLLFTWQVMVEDSYALSRIGEWASPNFHQFQPLALWLLGGMAAVLFQGVRLPPVRIAMVLGLLYLALKHVRSIELVGLLVPIMVAPALAAQWAGRRQAAPDSLLSRLAPRAGTAALGLCVLLLAAASLGLQRAYPAEPPPRSAPAAALAAAERAGAAGNVLNAYFWGGYLIHRGIPVHIDGRSDVYRDAFMREYLDALELRSSGALEALLAKYRIGWTLLEAGTPAIALLDRLPGWRRVYADEQAVVHVRTASANDTPAKP